MYGFSRMTPVVSRVVTAGSGYDVGGGFSVPEHAMFHSVPAQPPVSVESRVYHCCCGQARTSPSVTESATYPPDAHPYRDECSMRLPRTCTRRIGAAWETAHRMSPPEGVTARFSTERQKFCVALPSNHSASAQTPPVMFTSSGRVPRPEIAVWKPAFTCTG